VVRLPPFERQTSTLNKYDTTLTGGETRSHATSTTPERTMTKEERKGSPWGAWRGREEGPLLPVGVVVVVPV
jgi:hypothetical protein